MMSGRQKFFRARGEPARCPDGPRTRGEKSTTAYPPHLCIINASSSFQALPDDDKRPADTASTGSRYDNQVAVFGRAFQERLGNLNVFMVGCGALGCEYAKNFALMGVCCGPKGQLHITDNDRIEVSNLSRQFLFREENVGQPKSVAASQRAHHMNKEIKIDARQDLVGPDTEHIFDDAFWENLDLVCNALDNMKARFYVDDKCVFYEKPLLESGTMGTGANVDVVVPHKTRSYTDGGNADEGEGRWGIVTVIRLWISEQAACAENVKKENGI